MSTSAQQDQRELVKFHLERGQRLYEREADADALSELRRAVYLSPYEAQAHLLIGRIHLRAGRPQEAVNALKISIWSEDTAAARIALADAYLKLQNPSAARAELERALDARSEFRRSETDAWGNQVGLTAQGRLELTAQGLKLTDTVAETGTG